MEIIGANIPEICFLLSDFAALDSVISDSPLRSTLTSFPGYPLSGSEISFLHQHLANLTEKVHSTLNLIILIRC
jgi:hypothetical protein